MGLPILQFRGEIVEKFDMFVENFSLVVTPVRVFLRGPHGELI